MPANPASTPQRALVVIDPQLEYFDGPLAIAYPPISESLAKILHVIDVAESSGIPIVVVRHENPPGAAAFGEHSVGSELHPDIVKRLAGLNSTPLRMVTKRFASVFDGTDLAQQLQNWGVDTVTLVGYMTNNCVIASAAAAAPLGLTAEVLSDATGAINIANDVGQASAQTVQETLLTLLNSNFAAVADTRAWTEAVSAGEPLRKSNLVASARQGRACAGTAGS